MVVAASVMVQYTGQGFNSKRGVGFNLDVDVTKANVALKYILGNRSFDKQLFPGESSIGNREGKATTSTDEANDANDGSNAGAKQ